MLKQPYWQNYVNGEWWDGGAGRITVDNPAYWRRAGEGQVLQ